MDNIESLYIHFPFCRHLCNYCDFYKTAPSVNEREEKLEEFHKYLSNSIVSLNKFIDENETYWSDLKTLYIGGGTPSLWGESGAIFLENFLKENAIQLAKDCEATLEVNPGTWTEEGISSFRKIGFNRFSMGIQSTDDRFLEKLDRVHRRKEVFESLKMFQELEVNYSVDFMLGLPFSKELDRDIEKELEEILSYGPSHLSLYILTVKNNYAHYGDLPSDEWVSSEFLKVSELLRSRGFEHYEVSNFSLPGKESEHNSNYWKGKTIAALGPSATGYFAKSKKRIKWKTLEPKMDIECLSSEEEKMEKFYLGLRTSAGIDLTDYFEGNERESAIELVSSWKDRGLCKIEELSVKLTPSGYLLMDSLMDEVFLRLKTL